MLICIPKKGQGTIDRRRAQDECFPPPLINSLFDTVCYGPPLSFFHLKIIYDKNREVLENAIATEAE